MTDTSYDDADYRSFSRSGLCGADKSRLCVAPVGLRVLLYMNDRIILTDSRADGWPTAFDTHRSIPDGASGGSLALWRVEEGRCSSWTGIPEEGRLTDVHGDARERGPFIDGSYLEWYLGYRAARMSAGITVAVASDAVDETRTCL